MGRRRTAVMAVVASLLFGALRAENDPAASDLILLHFLWRHGDRSPSCNFSTNPDRLDSWPDGLGELTTLGMKQQYHLGLYLRQRYAQFLPNASLAKTVHVRSTDYNRTIMSALVNMAGMFPPDEHHLWNPNLSWQPIPVHTEPSHLDELLNMGATCPKAKSLRLETLKSKEAVAVMKENEQLVSFLRNMTGLPFDTIDDIRHVFDPINCARIHADEHALPEWLTDELFEKIARLFKLSTTFWVRSAEEKRLRGALLLQEIADRMVGAHKANRTAPLKLYTYSAHDETLVALLQNLEIYNASLFPVYASVVIFELYAVEGRPHVKVLMRIGDTGEVVPLKLHFCDTLCPLEIFYDKFADKAPKNWRKECGLESMDIAWKSWALFAFSLTAVAIGAGIVQAIYYFALRRRNPDSYAQLDEDGG